MPPPLDLDVIRPERLAVEVELDDLVEAVFDLPKGWTENSAEAVDYAMAFRVANTARRTRGAEAIAELHGTIGQFLRAHANLEAHYTARWQGWRDVLEVARRAASEPAQESARELRHVETILDALDDATEGVIEQKVLLAHLKLSPGRLSQILRQMEDTELIVREVNGREKRIRRAAATIAPVPLPSEPRPAIDTCHRGLALLAA